MNTVGFATIADMADRGYTAMPPVDELSCRTYRAELGRGLKSRPLSKACRVASNLGKFTPLDGGSNEKDITTEAVKKLRGATDLALSATKHTARAVNRSMMGMLRSSATLANLADITENLS